MPTYLFVAGAFQEMLRPIMNMTKACPKAVEGSSGKASIKMAPSGIAEAELICDKIILPEFGYLFARESPIFPPTNPPIELATANMLIRNPVPSCENPMSSNHIGANDRADQGNVPVTP